MLPTITADILDLPPGTKVQFPASFDEYEQLLDRLGDRGAVRIRFRDNHIYLMAPLPEHGNQTDILSDLVKALLRNTGQDWQGFTVITLKKTGMPGVEPDACFYIQNLSAVLGKARINLDIDPPPDLAMETDLTSITDINDYVPLAVPEVWIYKAGALNIYRFTGTGYADSDRSSLFPAFPLREMLPPFVRRAWTAGSSVALREFEQNLRA